MSTRGRGALLGRAGVEPAGREGGQGFRRRPLFLFFLYQFACDFRYSNGGHVDMRARSSTYSRPPIQMCVVDPVQRVCEFGGWCPKNSWRLPSLGKIYTPVKWIVSL